SSRSSADDQSVRLRHLENCRADFNCFRTIPGPLRSHRMSGQNSIMRLSIDDLSGHFRPRGCELREVELQLSVVYAFRQAGTLGSSFQTFVDVFPHHDTPGFRLWMVASFEAEEIPS